MVDGGNTNGGKQSTLVACGDGETKLHGDSCSAKVKCAKGNETIGGSRPVLCLQLLTFSSANLAASVVPPYGGSRAITERFLYISVS